MFTRELKNRIELAVIRASELKPQTRTYNVLRQEFIRKRHAKDKKPRYRIDGVDYMTAEEIRVAHNLRAISAVYSRLTSKSKKWVTWTYLNRD